jgi:hypothetical protein
MGLSRHSISAQAASEKVEDMRSFSKNGQDHQEPAAALPEELQ